MEGSEILAVKKHHGRNLEFMWMGSDGMRMCGTNGSQLWDIAFIAQALAETGLALEEENRESMMRALEWIERNQMTNNPKHYTNRRRRVLGHSAPKPKVILSALCSRGPEGYAVSPRSAFVSDETSQAPFRSSPGP